PDRAARGELRLPRGVLPAAERRAADGRAEEGVRRHRDAPHDGARAAYPPVLGVQARLAPYGGAGRRGGRAVGLLPRLAPHHRSPREISAFRLVAKLPPIVAMAFKYSVGQPFMYPKNDLSYTANFMRMMFAVPAEEYKPNPVLVRALDRIFILHADHEQNASTSTVRLAGSSGANPFACIASGIACLWGP